MILLGKKSRYSATMPSPIPHVVCTAQCACNQITITPFFKALDANLKITFISQKKSSLYYKYIYLSYLVNHIHVLETNVHNACCVHCGKNYIKWKYCDFIIISIPLAFHHGSTFAHNSPFSCCLFFLHCSTE